MYAKYRGVTHRAVQKAIRSGRIVAEPDGRIDAVRADAMWSAFTRPRGAAPTAADLEAAQARAKAMVILQHYRAKMEQLRYEVETGKLVSAEKVRTDVFGLARRCRDRMLGLPDRLAPRITGLTDAAEIERILTDEIRLACRELFEVGRA
jgi:phage terminase Nu1 subunit (DNA packaging protein)